MNKKVMSVIGLVLAIVGISTCFCVAIFFKEDVEVKIEESSKADLTTEERELLSFIDCLKSCVWSRHQSPP